MKAKSVSVRILLVAMVKHVLSGIFSQRNERKEHRLHVRKNGKLQPMGTELSSFLLN